MNEFMWKQLKIVSDQIDRLQAFQAECAKRGQYSDVGYEIEELLVRREHLAKALRMTVPPKVTAAPACIGFETNDTAA